MNNEIVRRHKILLLCLCGLSFSKVALAQTGAFFVKEDTVQANYCFEKGDSLTFYAKYDSANSYYKKAGAIFFAIANQTEKIGLWQKCVDSYNRMGDNLRLQDRHKEALNFLNKALETGTAKLGQNHPEVATTLDNIG